MTRVAPDGAIEVDGIHRHVADVRRVVLDPQPSSEAEDNTTDTDEEPDLEVRRSSRVTAQPWRYSEEDYRVIADQVEV